MRPIRTESSNLLLTLVEGDASNDLPAERVRVFAPDDLEQTGPYQDAIETAWSPDAGERRALANGALLQVRIWGTGHPPIAVSVSDEVALDAVPLVSRHLVDKAIGAHFAMLSEQLLAGKIPAPEVVLELWTRALEAAEVGETENLIKAASQALELELAAEAGAGDEPIPGQLSVDDVAEEAEQT